MIKEPKMPELEYASPQHYYFEKFKYSKVDVVWSYGSYSKITCIDCYGAGQIKDINDRDVVEGLKFARKITCSTCNGDKVCNIDVIFEKYEKEVLSPYIKNMEKYYNDLKMYKKIKEKLSKEEFEWLLKN